MSEKTKKLVLQKSAPDEVRIEFGMEFKRTFKRMSEPFAVEVKYAKMLLRSYAETFAEFVETPAVKETAAETPAKEAKK